MIVLDVNIVNIIGMIGKILEFKNNYLETLSKLIKK